MNKGLEKTQRVNPLPHSVGSFSLSSLALKERFDASVTFRNNLIDMSTGRILMTCSDFYFVPSFPCCAASLAEAAIREMKVENRNENKPVANVPALRICVSVCAYLPECLHCCVCLHVTESNSLEFGPIFPV